MRQGVARTIAKLFEPVGGAYTRDLVTDMQGEQAPKEQYIAKLSAFGYSNTAPTFNKKVKNAFLSITAKTALPQKLKESDEKKTMNSVTNHKP